MSSRSRRFCGLEQQRRSLIPAAGCNRDLGAQKVDLGVLELIEMPRLRHGQQSQRRIPPAGVGRSLRCGQCALRSLPRFWCQRR